MTDARFPDRWLVDRRVQGLSAEAHRAFVHALAWSASNRTEGRIDDAEVASISRASGEHFAELASAGVARRAGDCWVLVDFATTQTSKANLEAAEANRLYETEKKARQRAENQTSAAAVQAGMRAEFLALKAALEKGAKQQRADRSREGTSRTERRDSPAPESGTSIRQGKAHQEEEPQTTFTRAREVDPMCHRCGERPREKGFDRCGECLTSDGPRVEIGTVSGWPGLDGSGVHA